jgi:hypothetical protein
MAARFDKTPTFDGFDPKTVYQMVPVGEARPMAVITEEEECTIIVDPVNIARMQKFVFTAPLLEVPREERARVTPRNRITFEIFGKTKGNTTLFLVDRQGKAFATLMVSVKEKVTKKVALCLLSDRKRNCPFTAAEVSPLFPSIVQTFRQQANIELTQAGSIFAVNVSADLGDPIVADRPATRSAILGATPPQALLADLVVFYCWDIASATRPGVVGLNLGFDCYVEKQPNAFENAINTAHEIGHGLGLNHSGAKTLMAGDGNTRSSLLQQFEIDTINQTDV